MSIEIDDGRALVIKTRFTHGSAVIALAYGDMPNVILDYGDRCYEVGLEEPPGLGAWVWEGEIISGDGYEGPDQFQNGDWRRATAKDLAALLQEGAP